MPDLDLIRALVAERLHAAADSVAPDELGYVTGWRAWRVDREPDDGKVWLRSATYDYVWVPFAKARAECDRCTSDDPRSEWAIPGDNCSCGFYAAKSLKHLREMCYHVYDAESEGEVTIVGRLAMWGKVIEGSQGWKAEYAYPDLLYVPFEVARSLGRPVADSYGVPVTLLNLLDPNAKPGRSRLPVIEPVSVEPEWLRQVRSQRA